MGRTSKGIGAKKLMKNDKISTGPELRYGQNIERD